EEFRTPIGEILLHVLLHGSYHRGQIALRMRDVGEEPVNTDLITFVRERPAPEA
ncbi:MAG: damage-inducible protein DinB, partial [Gemmatimonadetes bacterium]|nr:damage-inducible protein DinB [Gemmatimonadota bacterium]NIT79146.1 damage-inducible protein DinB [Thermoplasmata archaeon]NIR78016.1 damage-inducible protein DinB [Gemmatimonadota bacterium]NIU30414.1 damage-inducible protein DinB [Gemmatimonadota bacterium]NIU35289.1 damage-inducible protein DinB [Gemmatimonadota bacterium]